VSELPDRVVYGTLAVATLVAFAWGGIVAGGEGLVFALFAVLVIGGSLLCVWERSVVRSAFCLLGTFGGTAGLFLLLGSDFLAVSQILIYVGGILALILFGVMLTPPDLTERKVPRVAAGLVAVGAGVAFVAAKVASTVKWVQAAELAPPKSATREIGIGFLAADQYMVAFELAAVVLTVALVAAVYIARRRKVDLEESPSGGDA
jgi:NADH:ubiquinone oxidoreductase subunit 6 (subunit J)